MFNQKELLEQLSGSKKRLQKRKSRFIELIGQEGSGARRACFYFLQPRDKVIWISKKWRLYAPLLWQLASYKKARLLGVECPQASRFRVLWKELHESQYFNVWILDYLDLKPGDLFFLHHLLAHTPTRLLILEEKVHSFCQERVHLQLSHLEYKLQWSKGGPLQPHKIQSPLLKWAREESCF